MAKEYFFITKFHFFTIKYDISHKKSDKRSHFLKKFCFRAVNRTFAEGSHRNFPSPKKGASPPFSLQKTVYWGYFSFKKASVLSHGEGRDWTLPAFHSGNSSLGIKRSHSSIRESPSSRRKTLLSQYERGIGRLGHFVSLAGIPLSFNTRDTPLSKMREGLDKMLTSFRILPFGLRPEAVILDRAVFASLSRGQSNPRRGFSSPVF